MLNPTFNMETHIISMKRTCFLQLRSLSKIRPDPGGCRETNPCLCNVQTGQPQLSFNKHSFYSGTATSAHPKQCCYNCNARKKVLHHHTQPQIFTGYLLLLVLISKFFYRSTSVYMELPRTISLPNFRNMHAASPT